MWAREGIVAIGPLTGREIDAMERGDAVGSGVRSSIAD